MSEAAFQVGIIGFGTVGEGVYRTLEKKAKKLESLLGRPLKIPLILVKNLEKNRKVQISTNITNLFEEITSYKDLDVVVEAAPDGETAYPYVTQLLKRGVSVITANKELVANYGEELHGLAQENNCQLLYEAAVAGGIPLLNTIRHTLKMNTIVRLEGILNGTSNFMLTKMREEEASFIKALQEAQELGYAEATPDKDVDGWDAYFKTKILSRWIYGVAPTWNGGPMGIRNVSVEDIYLAGQLNGRIKHVAAIVKEKDVLTATVEPSLVLSDHPLYGVEGVNNGVHLEGSIVGSIMLQGPGAGKYPTASAIVEDLVNLLTGKHEQIDTKELPLIEQETMGENEVVVSEASELWFITGVESVIYKYLASVGGEVIVSNLYTNQKVGVIAKILPHQRHAFQSFGSDIQFYPVLTTRDVTDVVRVNTVEKRTVSF